MIIAIVRLGVLELEKLVRHKCQAIISSLDSRVG